VDQLKVEVYAGMGMTPDGQLMQKIEEKKKLKVKGLKLKNRGSQRMKEAEEQPAVEPIHEIAEENRIRAMLGLPLLR
jgi:hypothetical protein